jgi:hypothetical protein
MGFELSENRIQKTESRKTENRKQIAEAENRKPTSRYNFLNKAVALFKKPLEVTDNR